MEESPEVAKAVFQKKRENLRGFKRHKQYSIEKKLHFIDITPGILRLKKGRQREDVN